MGARTKATEEDLRAAWEARETTRVVASRLRISKDTVSKMWRAMYGDAEVTARGKELIAESCSRVGLSGTGKKKLYKTVDVVCSRCGGTVTRTTFQVARLGSADICESCADGDPCPVCGLRVNGVRGMSGHFRHQRDAGDETHSAYAEAQEVARWGALSEPEDYVTCRECGYRASNLTGHIKVHGIQARTYQAKYGRDALLRSSAETRGIIETRRGRFPNGVPIATKVVKCPECDAEREVSGRASLSQKGLRCDPCKETEKLVRANARWAELSEPEDYVTCRACGTFRGVTLGSHIRSVHPDLVGRYSAVYGDASTMAVSAPQRNVGEKVHIRKSDLVPFMDAQGRVEVSRAARHFGCAHYTVLLRCRKHDLPTRNALALQKWVLDLVSKNLGAGYAWEWSHSEIKNPRTGYRFRFDGYFATHNLLVEVQGAQHFTYNPYWHKSEENYKRRQQEDALKYQLARDLGYRVLEVRHDEPFTDPSYLAGRLVQMGVLAPGSWGGSPGGVEELDLFG
jgi:ribosomal protein S27E